jgi:hypothetical protein
LPNVQAGSLFIIPSGLDNTKGRVFKVIRMSSIAVYPSEIICEIGPMFDDTSNSSDLHDFNTTNFNLLADGNTTSYDLAKLNPTTPSGESNE